TARGSGISKLVGLKSLCLRECDLINVPAGIGQLKLEELDLSWNKLSSLPREFWQLTALRDLNLNNNQLKEIPSDIRNFSGLECLRVKNNNLERVGPQVYKLSHLKVLDLRGNQLSTLPATLSNLKDTEIRAGGNPLTFLPEKLQYLKQAPVAAVSSSKFGRFVFWKLDVLLETVSKHLRDAGGIDEARELILDASGEVAGLLAQARDPEVFRENLEKTFSKYEGTRAAGYRISATSSARQSEEGAKSATPEGQGPPEGDLMALLDLEGVPQPVLERKLGASKAAIERALFKLLERGDVDFKVVNKINGGLGSGQFRSWFVTRERAVREKVRVHLEGGDEKTVERVAGELALSRGEVEHALHELCLSGDVEENYSGAEWTWKRVGPASISAVGGVHPGAGARSLHPAPIRVESPCAGVRRLTFRCSVPPETREGIVRETCVFLSGVPRIKKVLDRVGDVDIEVLPRWSLRAGTSLAKFTRRKFDHSGDERFVLRVPLPDGSTLAGVPDYLSYGLANACYEKSNREVFSAMWVLQRFASELVGPHGQNSNLRDFFVEVLARSFTGTPGHPFLAIVESSPNPGGHLQGAASLVGSFLRDPGDYLVGGRNLLDLEFWDSGYLAEAFGTGAGEVTSVLGGGDGRPASPYLVPYLAAVLAGPPRGVVEVPGFSVEKIEAAASVAQELVGLFKNAFKSPTTVDLEVLSCKVLKRTFVDRLRADERGSSRAPTPTECVLVTIHEFLNRGAKLAVAELYLALKSALPALVAEPVDTPGEFFSVLFSKARRHYSNNRDERSLAQVVDESLSDRGCPNWNWFNAVKAVLRKTGKTFLLEGLRSALRLWAPGGGHSGSELEHRLVAERGGRRGPDVKQIEREADARRS
ncbi:MAG: leucine-rich repeat domain-containing protein, partial [Promethearchaeota archaeon]